MAGPIFEPKQLIPRSALLITALLEIQEDTEAWHSAVHVVTKIGTWLSDWTDWKHSNRKICISSMLYSLGTPTVNMICSVMIFNIENFNTNCSKKEIKPYINFHFYISKESACNAGDPGLILGSVRSVWEGNGNPFHYSCLENSMDRDAWWATVYGVAKSQALLSN